MKIVSALIFFVMGAHAFAQEAAPGPAPELKQLEWQLGNWEGTFKWTMPGMEGDAKMTFTTAWEGNFLKTSSVMEMAGMKFNEVSYMGWDPLKKEYISWTFTNFAAMPRIERGKLDGNKLVLVSDPWDTGMGQMISRGTTIKKSNKEASFTIEFKNGEKWDKAAEGTFKKKS